MEQHITSRIRVDNPVVLIEVDKYLDLLDQAEGDVPQMLFDCFGGIWHVSEHYIHPSTGKSMKQDFEDYLKKNFPGLEFTTKPYRGDKLPSLIYKYKRLGKDGLAEDK